VAAAAGTQWLGLELRRHEAQDAEHAVVEFVARSRLAGRATRLHETSRFVREDGRWWYVDGDLAPAAGSPRRG
jgi:SEC-C motif-containing protein